MSINLISPSITNTAVLFADEVHAPNGSSNAIPTMTTSGGQTVSAALEIQSTLGALLLPRMTTVQMNALPVPFNGMIIYNTTAGLLYSYLGGVWTSIESSASGYGPGNPTYIYDTAMAGTFNLVIGTNTASTFVGVTDNTGFGYSVFHDMVAGAADN